MLRKDVEKGVLDLVGLQDGELQNLIGAAGGRASSKARAASRLVQARKMGEHWAWTKTALISAYDKAGVGEFAEELTRRGWRILASRGTAAYLNDRDPSVKAWDIAEIVGKPILGHRVVTLSRELHAALLARPEVSEDMAELDAKFMPLIDLVYVNMYPLHDAIAKSGSTLESVVEMTDIGGPTLLRSAAKGRRIVVCRPEQIPLVLKFIDGDYTRVVAQSNLTVTTAVNATLAFERRFLSYLTSVAEYEVGTYCLASSNYHHKLAGDAFVNELKSMC